MGLQMIGKFFAGGFKGHPRTLGILVSLGEIPSHIPVECTYSVGVDLKVCAHPGLKYFASLAGWKLSRDH